MPMLADTSSSPVGVDTLASTHTAAVVAATTGAMLERLTDLAAPAGYQRLLKHQQRHGGRRVWAIESTGGYGAGLTRFLHTHAEQVVAGPAQRTARRHGAKSDSLDAIRGAREALSRDQLAQPAPLASGRRCRCGWPPAAPRSRPAPTPNANSTPWWSPPLTRLLAGCVISTPRLVRTCRRLRRRPPGIRRPSQPPSLRASGPPHPVLNAEVADHTRAITTLVQALATLTCSAGLKWARSWLRSCCAPGPIPAAAEAMPPSPCWAALRRSPPPPANGPGAPTIPATASSTRPCTWSSPSRAAHDPATRAYAQRRRAEGKTNREIRRCLVRYAPASSTDSSRPTRALILHRSVREQDQLSKQRE